jgi:hypothetical protein
MCTVSWVHETNGYQLFCNRDEKRERPAADPPAILCLENVQAGAPRDKPFGGTWVGVNEFGLGMALLNRYPDPNLGEPSTSRGLVIGALLSAPSSGEVARRLRRLDLGRYPPFTLAFLEPGCSASAFLWDGSERLLVPHADALLPLVSSSVDQPGVERQRRLEFLALRKAARDLTPEALAKFHRSHGAEAGAKSVCMHRDDAETVSFTRIVVNRECVRLQYWPDSPCRNLRPSEIMLRRKG